MSQNKPKVLNKWVITIVALLLAVSVLSACGQKKQEGAAATAAPTGKPTDVIATYKDNGTVTRGQFDAFINTNKILDPQFDQQAAQYAADPAFQQSMLQQYIAFQVLSARADDKSKAEADKLAQDQLKQKTDELSKMEGGLDKQLKDKHVEQKDLESFLKTFAYARTSLESKVTDQQLQDEYKKLAAGHEFDIATVSHILVSVKDPQTQKDIRTKDEAMKRAKEVLDKLSKGEDFAALAKQYSDDPGSKDTGGTYKDANVNGWDPDFKKAALELPLNKLSDPPVETSFGYHVMKVESRSTKTLEEVKTSIKLYLAQQAYQTFTEKELPGLILTNTLPTPTPAPTATPAASSAVSPDASPAASPTSSPAAK
jgi:foldase protein PrsA